MRIAVIGAGAQGSTYGGMLAQRGHDVWLITRREEQAEALRSQGLCLESGGSETILNVEATADPGLVGEVGLVCVFVKSYDTATAAESAKQLLGPETWILTLQSGLGNVETLQQTLGDERVIAGVSYMGTRRVDDRHVITGEATKTVIGELDGSVSVRVSQIAKVFQEAGIVTEVSSNVMTLIWDKLLIIAGQNALGAITGLRFGEMLACQSVEKILRRVLSEVEAVAAALEIDFSFQDSVERVKQNWSTLLQHKVSMRQDIEAGRKTEIDAINGAIVRLGQELGIETPYNEMLQLLVKTLEEANALRDE